MKNETTIISKRQKDGTLVQVMPDGSTRPMPKDKTDWTQLKAMTEQEAEAAALSDPDNQPATKEDLKKAQRGPQPRFLRMSLRLSREEFSEKFRIPLDVLEAWEARRTQPDDVAKAYLKLIATDPDFVEKSLKFTSGTQAAE